MYLYMICGQDSFFVRQLTFSPDNNVATFIYSTGGASKTGQMQEVAEGQIHDRKVLILLFFVVDTLTMIASKLKKDDPSIHEQKSH